MARRGIGLYVRTERTRLRPGSERQCTGAASTRALGVGADHARIAARAARGVLARRGADAMIAAISARTRTEQNERGQHGSTR